MRPAPQPTASLIVCFDLWLIVLIRTLISTLNIFTLPPFTSNLPHYPCGATVIGLYQTDTKNSIRWMQCFAKTKLVIVLPSWSFLEKRLIPPQSSKLAINITPTIQPPIRSFIFILLWVMVDSESMQSRNNPLQWAGCPWHVLTFPPSIGGH